MSKTARTVPVLVVLAALLLIAGPASADTTRTFTNPASIAVPSSGSVGAGLPYPSSIEVSGMTGPILEARLTLNRFGHERPIDVGVLLVPPSGKSTMIMHRRCGFDAVEDRTWTFTAFERNPEIPLDGPCDGSVYRPGSAGQGLWPPPAPAGLHLQQLDHLVGDQANGTWSLYVADFAFEKIGDIEGGWSLELTTGDVDAEVPGAGTEGPASPYPMVSTVAGPDRVITDLNVFLPHVWHQRPDDLDLLLVGPRGQTVVLMSDSCGTSEASSNYWRWDDEAGILMPHSTACGSLPYLPTDGAPDDSWPAPAPAGPYARRLSAFDLTDPVGDWRLFVNDDSSGAVGFFIERFELDMSTRAKASVAFAEGAVELAEGTGRALVLRRVATTEPGAGAVTVTSRPVSADPGGDFTPVSAVVEFAAGETEKTVRVDALTDAETESDEVYAVAIGTPSGDAAVGTPSSVAVTIPGPATGGGSGAGGGGDRAAPVLSRFSASPRRFRVGRAPKRRRRGTTLTLGLSEAASVRFDARRIEIGRRVGSRCRKPTRTNRRRGRCRLLTPKGGFTRPIAAGRSTLAFSGRIGGRTLKPGRYVLRATPRDAAGNAGTPRSISIRIVR